MELPPKIKVNGYDIAIVRRKEIDHTNPYGMFDEQTQEIQLRETFATNYLEVDTLLHEVLHALFGAMHLKLKEEEQVCSIMATGLMGVFRDNPDLMKWIQGRLK